MKRSSLLTYATTVTSPAHIRQGQSAEDSLNHLPYCRSVHLDCGHSVVAAFWAMRSASHMSPCWTQKTGA